MKKNILFSLAVSTLFAFLLAYIIVGNQATTASASALSGQDYSATTTAGNSVYGSFTASRSIKSGYGSFGGIIVTGANTGVVNVYDATTSDVTKRAASMASSSILISSYPASLAAGDYTGNDTQLANGLYIDLVSGIMPTTTIKYR